MTDKYIRNISNRDWRVINKFRKKNDMTWNEFVRFLADKIKESKYDEMQFSKMVGDFSDDLKSTKSISGEFKAIDVWDSGSPIVRPKLIIKCPYCASEMEYYQETCPHCKSKV